jgi:mRNA-degrading endonuclease YafQ of YafQ-DinJ toxin-antitoxin module
MTYAVDTPAFFIRKARRFPPKHPSLPERFEEILDALQVDPFQPSLRLHPLLGELQGLHAVSLNYDFRVVRLIEPNVHGITLINIGSHDEVYGD